MDLVGGPVLPLVWATLGVTIVVCGLRSARSERARATGIGAASVLWVAAGAGANALVLADGSTYTGFADGSSLSFVTETWESLVVPHHGLFIGLLIAGEALAGVLVLVPGRTREWTLVALMAFNATLVVFGWGFLIWSAPVLLGLWALRRTEVRNRPSRRSLRDLLRNRLRPPSGDASWGRHRSPRSRVPSP